MSRVLLVNTWQHPKNSLYPRSTAVERYLPLNLLYVATALRNSGHEVGIIDPSNEGVKHKDEKILRHVRSEASKSDVIAFSSSAYDWIPDQTLMNAAAEVNPRIVVGGWGAERYPNDYLDKTPALAVLRGLHGEALDTLAELVPIVERAEVSQEERFSRFGEGVYVGLVDAKTGGKLSGIAGLSHKTGSGFKTTKPRKPRRLPQMHSFIADFGLRYGSYRNNLGQLVLPLLGSVTGCSYALNKKACRYCAQHTYLNLRRLYGGRFFSESVGVTCFFDVERVLSEIVGCFDAAGCEGEEFSMVFFVDDCMVREKFKLFWDRTHGAGFPVELPKTVFSSRPDFLTPAWMDFLCENRDGVGVNLGLEFFNSEDVAYTARSSNPHRYLASCRRAVGNLTKHGVVFKAFTFLQATRIWRNIGLNLRGALGLVRKHVYVTACPTILADFTEMEDDGAECLATDHYLGMEIPGFISYGETPESELMRIKVGLHDFFVEHEGELRGLCSWGGLDVLSGVCELYGRVCMELESR